MKPTYDEIQIGAVLTYCLVCQRHYFCTVPRSVCARCCQAQRSCSIVSAEIPSLEQAQAHASANREHLPGEAKQLRAEGIACPSPICHGDCVIRTATCQTDCTGRVSP
jgi:hypothetical protein